MATLLTRFSLVTTSAILGLAALVALADGASAQYGAGFIKSRPNDLPDSSQFYMSRRQVQVIDDSPIVKYGGGPGGAAGGAAGGFGGMPAGAQMGLPRAGFQSYTNSAPSLTTPLPKVNNGVPPKAPPVDEKAMRAKANALAKAQAKAQAKSVAQAQPKAPEGIKAYNSYKGYNPAASLGGAASGAGAAGSTSTTATKVKGNVLHWSRHRGE